MTTPSPRSDDRARITDVMARYADAVDRRDLDRLSTCFTADAVADYGLGAELRGRESVTAFIGTALTAFRSTQHLIGTHTFEFEGDTATTTTYVQAAHVVAAGEPGEADRLVIVGGRYCDRFVVEDGAWLIAERRFEAMWTTDAPSASMAALAGGGGSAGR